MLKYQVRASTSASSTTSSRLAKSQSPSLAESEELKGVASTYTTSTPAVVVKHRTIIAIGDEGEEERRTLAPPRPPAASFNSRSSTTSCSTNSSAMASIPLGRSNSFNSLSSLSSRDSFERESSVLSADWGYLRVFTFGIKSDTDYKTLKITSRTKCRDVVEMILNKFRLNFRDINLFQLWMEVRTRHNGQEFKSILELDKDSCPLELQLCHPLEKSRFILSMVSNAILARIYDGDICPQSNYKSVLISRRTTCLEALHLMLQLCRVHYNNKAAKTLPFGSTMTSAHVDYRLFVVENESEAQIPKECMIAGVYLSLMPNQRIVLRKCWCP